MCKGICDQASRGIQDWVLRSGRNVCRPAMLSMVTLQASNLNPDTTVRDWPSNCQHLPPSHILSPTVISQRLAKHLRTVEGCDFVIALTHMRLVEDLAVSNATGHGEERVDLLLGGHDHEVVCRFAGDVSDDPSIILQGRANDDVIRHGQVANVEGTVRIVKSGTDWKSYSVVQLIAGRDEGGKAYLQTIKCTPIAHRSDLLLTCIATVSQYVDITRIPSYTALPTSTETLSILSSIQARVTHAVQYPLLHARVPLDGRSSIIRSQETNLGNMLADAVRAFYDTEIAFVNSGGVRCDRIIEPTRSGHNVLRVKDIIGLYPHILSYRDMET